MSFRNKTTPGTSKWICSEMTAMSSLVLADMDHFALAAKAELDWINEHINEVLSAERKYAFFRFVLFMFVYINMFVQGTKYVATKPFEKKRCSIPATSSDSCKNPRMFVYTTF